MRSVLHIVNGTDAGGISSVVRNYYHSLNHDEYHFDIATAVPEKGDLYDSFIDDGFRVLYIGKKHGFNLFPHMRRLRSVLCSDHYDVVHAHAAETSWVDLMVAKRCGVPILVAHAHNADKRRKSFVGWLRSRTGMLMLKRTATTRIACGRDAAVCTFGRHSLEEDGLVLLPNAIDVDKYVFSDEKREAIRGELGIPESAFVVGTVGRMSNEKNQRFITDIFPGILEKCDNAFLVLVGDGDQRESIFNQCKETGILERVLFTGARSDIEAVLSAFDVFVLPSLYEGFPVSAIEAAANGLPIILSSSITDELSFLAGTYYVSLDDQRGWSDAILNHRRGASFRGQLEQLKNNGYDIASTSQILEKVYEGVQ